jgi:hypothetical protein
MAGAHLRAALARTFGYHSPERPPGTRRSGQPRSGVLATLTTEGGMHAPTSGHACLCPPQPH